MTELPTPDPESRAHSDDVLAYVLRLIEEQDGFLSFAEFMQACLYAPSLGYYVAGARKFGEGGDFVTAPELTPVFGRLVATQVATVREELDVFDMLELGAGTGAFAHQVLTKLADLGSLPDRYLILEASADLRDRQRQLLSTLDPDLARRVEWLEDIPEALSGVILANEVIDALPVERFMIEGEQTWQLGVGAHDGQLVERRREAPTVLADAVADIQADRAQAFPDAYVSEVCLAAGPWVRALVACLERGLILFFDYGVDRGTYYRDDRHDGWLRCHFRHHAHNDALLYPGIQDLTAWVDFTAVATAGLAAGGQLAGYVNQAGFLMGAGLEEELGSAQDLPEKERLQFSHAVRRLMLPGEMGEHFKCLGLSKGVTTPPALRMMDRTHTL